jgi:hypothetical protein
VIGVRKEITSDAAQQAEVGEVWHFDVMDCLARSSGGIRRAYEVGRLVKLFLDSKDLVPAVWSSLESRGSCGFIRSTGVCIGRT